MRVIAIYDNSAATFDRYTVITDQQNDDGTIDVLGLSANPGEPDGFSQMGSIRNGSFDHLGRKVSFETLPGAVQAHIAQRLFSQE